MHNLLLSLVYFLFYPFGLGVVSWFLPFLDHSSLFSLFLCICNSNPITETHTSAFSFFPSIPHLNQTNQINDSAPPLGASTTHAEFDTPSRNEIDALTSFFDTPLYPRPRLALTVRLSVRMWVFTYSSPVISVHWLIDARLFLSLPLAFT